MRFRRYLDDLNMCELSDGVVWQVDVPPSVKLAHASSVQHGLGAVQTTAARGGSVDCRGDFKYFNKHTHQDRQELVLSTDHREIISELRDAASFHPPYTSEGLGCGN